MRSRSEVLKQKAADIVAGKPVTEETPPASSATEPQVEQPKRRSRSQVATSSAATDSALTPPTTTKTALSDPEVTSQALVEELEAQRVAQQRRESEQRREAAGKTAADLTLGAGNDRIVTSLFQLEDPMAGYQRVRASLRMGRASGASYGQLVDALDEAEENAVQAMEIYINATVALEAFEIDAKIVLGTLRDDATAILEDEKAQGHRKKAITNDDVESVMAAKFADEWQSVSGKRAQAQQTVKLLGDLCERARERCKDLRAMVSKFRGD